MAMPSENAPVVPQRKNKVRPLPRRGLRRLRWGFRIFVCCVLLPIGASGGWHFAHGWPPNWRVADWSSAAIAPDPQANPQAMIIVYAARAGNWKGIFAVHSWIAIKAANETRFTRYEVVGWGQPVRRNAYPADGRWYSNRPYAVHTLQGAKAARLIPRIEAAIARYPARRRGSYRVWPGPNSNTFIAWLARQVPDWGPELPAVAVGKDYLGDGLHIARTPSGTGWQIAWSGYAGLALGLREGLEIHIAGSTIGIDPDDLAVKLPALGKISAMQWMGYGNA